MTLHLVIFQASKGEVALLHIHAVHTQQADLAFKKNLCSADTYLSLFAVFIKRCTTAALFNVQRPVEGHDKMHRVYPRFTPVAIRQRREQFITWQPCSICEISVYVKLALFVYSNNMFVSPLTKTCIFFEKFPQRAIHRTPPKQAAFHYNQSLLDPFGPSPSTYFLCLSTPTRKADNLSS